MLINGTEITVQFGIESTFGTAPTMTDEILVTKAEAKVNRDLKEMGENTGGQVGNKGYSMARSVELSLSFLARADQLGAFLFCALGKEGTPGASGTGYAHTFTFSKASADELLPSMAMNIDWKTEIKEYNGLKIESLKGQATSGDLFKVDVTLRGLDEAAGALETLTPSVIPPFRFAGATFQLEGVPLLCDDVSFEINNNLDKTKSTIALAAAATLYYDEPQPQVRAVTVTGKALYADEIEDVRDDYILDTADLTATVVLNFKGSEYATGEIYNLLLTIPEMQLQDDAMPSFSLQKLMSSLTLKAVQPASAEPLTAVLTNAKAAKYLV